MFLPLFWDATIHWQHARIIMEQWWQFVEADYPPLYYYIVNILSIFFWEKAYNLLVYISTLLIIIYSYLLTIKISNKKQIWILIMIIVWFSSKLIFYSARLYQEIFITTLFLISFYYLYIIIKKHNQKIFYLLIFIIGVTLSVKQQWLFILYPSILIFYFILLFFKKTTLKNFVMILLIPLIIWVWAYWVLFHNKWMIIIWNEDFKVLNIVNYFWQTIFNYNWKKYNLKTLDDAINYSEKIDNNKLNKNIQSGNQINQKLEEIKNKQYSKWTQRAEKRHITFFDIFKDYDKFNWANSLYSFSYWYKWYNWIYNLLFIFLIWWLLIFFIKHFKKDKTNFYLLTYLVIFLSINYYLFQRNTDQSRYHLFIPFYILIFIIYFLDFILKKQKLVYLIITITLISLISTSIIFFEKNRWAVRWQIYAPSKWWIYSIIETWKWMSNNLPKNIEYFQMCWNELSYYAHRKNIWDWRIYFLNNKDIINYFNTNNLQYFVLFNSQLVNDSQWNGLCKIPKSFTEKLHLNFTPIFISNKKDITVYKLNTNNEKNTYN